MTLPLTSKQERVWRYIKACERSPTYAEMARDLGYKSQGSLNLTILALKQKGFVTYTPMVARSLVAINPEMSLAGFPSTVLAAELARRLGE